LPIPASTRFFDSHHKTGNRSFSHYKHLIGYGRGHVCDIACLEFLPHTAPSIESPRVSPGPTVCGRVRVPPVTKVAAPASTQNRWAWS